MGAQMSKTELVLNVIGHRLDDGPPVPIMYVGPTESFVRKLSRERFVPLLQAVPSLWEKTARGHRLKVDTVEVGGVVIGFAWAGSATELAGRPVGLVLVDERDRMEDSVADEGDVVELARARTKNYHGGRVGVFSTPTIRGASPIMGLWEEGTRERWAWRCPECSDWTIPRRELLSYPEDAEFSEIRARARVACEHCGAVFGDDAKRALNANGRYLPHTIDDDGRLTRVDIAPANPTRSFWVSGLASPWVSVGQVAELIARAERSGSPDRLQSVINTWLGEPWAPAGEAPEWREVLELRQPYQPGDLPFGVQEVTAGVDVQSKGLYFVLRGWGFNGESWLLKHGFVAGDTEFDSVWMILSRVLEAGIGEGRERRRPRLVFVDSGYRPGDRWHRPVHQVYAWCQRHAGWWCPTKGHETWQTTVTPKVLQQQGGLTLWHVNTDECKGWLMGRLQWPEDQPGGFHLHRQVDDEYARQLTAEEAVVRPNGSRVWRRVRRDNHYLDCEVLARAAAVVLRCDELPEIGKRSREPEIRQPPVSREWIPDLQNW